MIPMRPIDAVWDLLKASDISMVTPFDYMMADPSRQYNQGGHDPSQGEMPVMLNFDVGGSGEANVDGMRSIGNPYGPGEKNKGSDFRVSDFDELAMQHLLHGAFQQAPIVNAMASIGEDVSGFPRTTTMRGAHPLADGRFDFRNLGVGQVDPNALDPIRSTLGMPSQRGLSTVEQQEADRRAAEVAAQATAAKQARARAQVQAANAKRLARAKADAEARRANQPQKPDINAAMAAIRLRQQELGLE